MHELFTYVVSNFWSLQNSAAISGINDVNANIHYDMFVMYFNIRI